MSDIERQLRVIDKIINATDKEIHDVNFLLSAIKEYGIAPLAWLKELDDTAYYTENGMLQVPGEFALFCHYLADMKIESAIEIGVYRGRSSYFMCAILYRNNPNLIYDIVDIEDYLDGYDEFHKILPCLNKCIPNTSDDFAAKSYDFVFIDADHSFDAAMKDYLNVGRYAKKLVCFHDIFAHEYDSCNGGIVRCWEEVGALTPSHSKMIFSQFPNRWMGIGVVVNSDTPHTIGEAGDYEKIQKNVKFFLEEIEGKNNIYVYGARNDSRRMYDALLRKGINVQGLVICDESENPENVQDYNVKIMDELSKEDATVIMCFRESLRDYPLQQLQEYNNINVVITDDKTASFI